MRARPARLLARVLLVENDARTHDGSERAAHGGALVFVRAHDVEVERRRNGHPAIAAVVEHVRPVGGVVRVELLTTPDRERIEAEIARARQDALGLRAGEIVYVTLRNARVIADEEAAAR